MRKPIATLGVTAALTCIAAIAQASTLSFGTPPGSGEASITLANCSSPSAGCTSSTGTAGTIPPTTINFSSSDLLDFASGNATITAHGGGNTFSNLVISTPGFTFTDLDFHAQITGNTNSDITVAETGNSANSISGSLTHGADTEFLVDSSTLLSSLTISSVFGLSEIKQLEISGLTPITTRIGTPIPAPLLLFGSGLGAIGLFGRRKKRGSRFLAA